MATFPVFYHHGTLVQTPYIEELASALDPTLRTEVEAGYVASRARFTRAPRRWTLRFDMMTAANKATLRAFEIARGVGASSFTWADPEYVPVNLLTNPGFELPGYDSTTIPGWTLWNTPATSTTTNAYFHAGANSLRHVQAVGSSPDVGRMQSVVCVPGNTYTASVWAFKHTVASSSIFFYVYDGTYHKISSTVDNAWEQLTTTITAGPTQTTFTLWLGGKGDAWFDDAFVSTPSIIVRFTSPISYVPVANTNNTRWNVSFTLEEA